MHQQLALEKILPALIEANRLNLSEQEGERLVQPVL